MKLLVMRRIVFVRRGGGCQPFDGIQAGKMSLVISLTLTVPLVVAVKVHRTVSQTSLSGSITVHLKGFSRAAGTEGLAARVAASSCGRLRPIQALLTSRSSRTSVPALSFRPTTTIATTGLRFAVS